MVHDRVVDRRHRHQLVDAVLADGAKEALEVQRAGEDLDATAVLEHRDQLAVAAGDVEQRHRDQRRDRGPSARSTTGSETRSRCWSGSWRARSSRPWESRSFRSCRRSPRGPPGSRSSTATGSPSGSAAPGAKVKAAPESSITYAASSSVKRVLTGTTTAPASCVPKNASTQSIPLARRSATRSPRPTPARAGHRPRAQPAATARRR